MVKVNGLNKLAHMVETQEKIQKLNKQAKSRKLKEMVAQGIDRELAKVMIEAGAVSLF